MTKRTILLLLPAFLISVPSLSQSDEVTLKNGSVIRGNVKNLVPGGTVTIDDMAGNTWVYAMTEVEKIEEIEKAGNSYGTEFSKGFVNMTTIGFLAGSQSSTYMAPFSFQTSFGYLTEAGIYGGLLAGLEFLNVNHIPLMIDLQYSLRQSDVVPVLIARGGYALPAKGKEDYYGTLYSYSGGIAGSIGMGVKIRSRESFAWDVSLLYRYMQINYQEEYEWQDFPNKYRDVYNRLEIRLGFYLGM